MSSGRADYCYLLVRGSNSQIVASASPNFIVSSCLDTWKDIHYTNILIGPGLDTEEESVALFTDVMSTKPSRLLLDADAIRIVCMLLKQQDVVTSGLLNQLSAAQSIITPTMLSLSTSIIASLIRILHSMRRQ